jgi:hypothetical protein
MISRKQLPNEFIDSRACFDWLGSGGAAAGGMPRPQSGLSHDSQLEIRIRDPAFA